MNKQIRRLGVGLIAAYLALFAMLNWIQVFSVETYNENPRNTAQVQRDFNRPRGTITSADGAVLARSVPNTNPASARFDYQREYPEGDLFGHITGYFSYSFGSAGVEKTYNDQLSGQDFGQQIRGIADLFVGEANIGDVQLSVRRDLQQLARDELGDREGSVVAIDVKTGELLAFWSYPSYDPNVMANHDAESVEDAYAFLDASPGRPLVAHQYQERYFPGSTFKVVTGSNGVQSGQVTPDNPVYPQVRGYTPPLTTQEIQNFGGQVCGGRLFEILARSCNSAFAQMGVDLGPDIMVKGSESFGFNDAPPIDLPRPATSAFPTDFTQNTPRLAQASIGQNDVAATPLQMALVAAGIANGGVIMKPHVMAEVLDKNLNRVGEFDDEAWRTAISPETAQTMREAMVNVVTNGSARAMAIPGYEVGAKTGTAQLGTDPPRSHTWMIGWGGPAGDPQIAVSVVVLNQSGAREATGGEIAGPIAHDVLAAALATRNGG